MNFLKSKITWMGILIILLVLTVVFLLKFEKTPSERLVSKWYNLKDSSIIEFLEEGIVNASISHRIPLGHSLPKQITGWKINNGFELIKFPTEKNFIFTLFSQSTKSRGKLTGQYASLSDTIPWAKVLLSTNDEGMVIYETAGEGYRVGVTIPMKLSTNILDKEVVMEGISFITNYVDRDLNFCGFLSLNGYYRFKDSTDFEVYLPLTLDDTHIGDLIFLQGSVKENHIIIVKENIDEPEVIYQESNERHKKINLEDTRSKRGVLCFGESTYIINGSTVGRFQNATVNISEKQTGFTENNGKEESSSEIIGVMKGVISLQGKVILGETALDSMEIKAEMSQGGIFYTANNYKAPLLHIIRGLYIAGEKVTPGAYALGVIEAGEEFAVEYGQWIIPFKLEKPWPKTLREN